MVKNVMSPSRLLSVMILTVVTMDTSLAQTHHVWEKVEITLTTNKSYENPYTDVEVWADLKGPGFCRRCYGFWDGDNTFRIRLLATTPGKWSWRTGSNQQDAGLNGKTGTFTAVDWDEARKNENPCRRGMIKATANGHAFEYADGTPFFLLGDTWWATPTFRFRWHNDNKKRPIGPNAGFKDYVRFRRAQGFNCFAMIAALPNWANDGKPRSLKTTDGTVLRSAWQQPGTKSAKDMHDENGNRAFFFPGKVPGFENCFPDLERINPKYFQNLDEKIDYLNAHGIVPFIEVARRDIGQAWKKYYPWPASYTRYIQYIWSRYQANICLFSPIHFDWSKATIPADDWNHAANKVIEQYGPPPFGTLAGTNSNPSSLHNFGHVDQAKWLTFHQIGNNQRTHNSYELLTEIFQTNPPVPGINGEPYYAGMEEAPGGTPNSALYCRSSMYGSVLSGGLGGHIYGAGGWDGGLWGGNVEEVAENHIWDAMKWPSGDQMRHLAAFVLSEGRRYQDLVPSRDLLKPNASGKPKGFTGWAYGARTGEKDLFLLYFEKDCPKAELSGAVFGGTYNAQWFNPRTGDWIDAGPLHADPGGDISLPDFPDHSKISQNDWGLKLTFIKGIDLIVRGDDIGSSHAANVACIRSYKEGIMTSVELMVPCPWFPEAVKMLNENPGLDVGVHVTLTSEWENIKWRPLTWAPSLTDKDGYFYPTLWRRKGAPAGTALREAKWKIEDVEKEMRAQIEMAKRKVPHVSHMSCHMGCSGWHPRVKALWTKLEKEYNLDIIPSDRDVKRFRGYRGAKTAEDRIETFIKNLEDLKPGTYLFVEHPGLATAEMNAIGHVGYENVAEDRDAVTEVFTSERVNKTIDRLGIKLISYANLKKSDKEN